MLTIDIQNKSFDSDVSIIKNLHFSVDKNEIVALIGPSGAGKSTLLNLIAGLDEEFEGTITSASCATHNIGLMFQEARLMPWLTVLENVLLVAEGRKDKQKAKQDALDILKLVGMESHEHAYPKQLSGGMTKRVALARAFMFNPEVLLMDEPFASLDAPSAEQLRQKLLILQQQMSSSILYVTHDLTEAVAIADRIIFLTEKPMTVIEQREVSLPRPRYLHDPEVSEICQFFYRQFPDLLCSHENSAKCM
ncbi:ABC transporter ATP-binding protein [Aliiglaciecola sp. 3_MG-2023]|uniref:ABC transporter ATP-binding protein n=1 Tax=Aliiglaciecola sp. 3_MG-2023 TaxID=3062644 RepID=UPI0026E35519|nr:ABC transporter ATP-binding protein [Aliiglaciecola sp. 3_MG-2023]MDO6694593.1 ABC transporter ATP-binding protein [Aliiglaciecola sp. 3_MG-2023]